MQIMKTKHIAVDPSLFCTGCGACRVICPRQAIAVPLNDEGFFEARVNEDLCIDCGLCRGVCVKYLDDNSLGVDMQPCDVAGCYAADASVQQSCTSGGLAYEIARWGLENEYRVAGVVYDYTSGRAVHVLADRPGDLEPMKGSKYIQSDTTALLDGLTADARSHPDRKYLCFGTPCQILGIRRLFDRLRLPNPLLLVDLFCHGVPSYLAWDSFRDYLRGHCGIPAIDRLSFRHKCNGWHQYTIRVEGGRTYCRPAYSDPFYRLFFDNVVLNKACFRCRSRKRYAASDLRLGDFLGKTYEHREDGISAVLTVSAQGRELVDNLTRSGRIVVDGTFPAPVCLQSQSTADYTGMPLRDATIRELQNSRDILKALSYYTKRLPRSRRLKSRLKIVVSRLPLPLLIRLRRLYRRS